MADFVPFARALDPRLTFLAFLAAGLVMVIAMGSTIAPRWSYREDRHLPPGSRYACP